MSENKANERNKEEKDYRSEAYDQICEWSYEGKKLPGRRPRGVVVLLTSLKKATRTKCQIDMGAFRFYVKKFKCLLLLHIILLDCRMFLYVGFHFHLSH